MTLPFAVRLRAHSAGLESVAERLMAADDAAGRAVEDLLALASGPLPLLGAVSSAVTPREAAVVGLLPVEILADAQTTAAKALAHRAAAEGEVLELFVAAPAAPGSLEVACEATRSLLGSLRGAAGRIDEPSLQELAAAAGIADDAAAERLAAAGISLVTRVAKVLGAAPTSYGPLPVRESFVVPQQVDAPWIRMLLDAAGVEDSPAGAVPGKSGPCQVALLLGDNTTGIALLRAASLARLAGFTSISVGGGDELKGPDGCLAFGADRLEAQLDPPGTMGSRTRAYGEAAIHGAQLTLLQPARRATSTRKVAHILDEVVDPSLLPGGDPASPGAESSTAKPHLLEVRS